jgi:hypothetical protein
MAKENCWQHSLQPALQYQFIENRSIQNPIGHEKRLNLFSQQYKITTNNVIKNPSRLIAGAIVPSLAAVTRTDTGGYCARLQNEKIQVLFGLKIANAEYILFNFINPSRVSYSNNAMTQVMM